MHKFTKILVLVLFACVLHLGVANADVDAGSKQPKVIFTLIKNDPGTKNFSAQIDIKNIAATPTATVWELAFNFAYQISSVENANLVRLSQGGDFYLVKFIVTPGAKTISIPISGQSSVKKYSDAPSGYFLIQNPDSTNPNIRPRILPIESETILPNWQPDPGEDENSKNQKKNNTSIEGNPIETTRTADDTLIVPLPVEIKRLNGEFHLNQNTVIQYQDMIANSSADFFVKSIQSATGFTLAIKPLMSGSPSANTILLTTQGADALDLNQRKEGYILEVTSNNVIIRALTDAGFFYGLQSLRQLLPPQIYNQSVQQMMDWKIPSVYIRDYPRFEYRGLQLDVARHFVKLKDVKRLIDLMSIHKLNYFEWHLTDDEGWRIEIKKYPELTAKGAFRAYDPIKYNAYDLLPSFGSGAFSYGGFYTQDDIREVVKYADERHVTIVPEIDVPGHARAMITSLPRELIDPNDHSQYTSVQGYHDNVLSPCKKETFEVIDNIMTEVAALFPGKYIHVGGDEVPQGVWEKSCMAQKYNPQDPNFKDLVQNEFMQKVEDIVSSKGKILAGWEEIAGDAMKLKAPLRVYIWNTGKIDQAYKKSAYEGYEVIMSPAENLYFDLAYSADPKEPGQYWAGYVDTFSAYSFTPIDASKGQSDLVIKGVQGQLWSEQIDSETRLDYLAFPKVAGLSELAWTQAVDRNWRNFYARMREKHLPRLDNYGVQYRHIEFASPVFII